VEYWSCWDVPGTQWCHRFASRQRRRRTASTAWICIRGCVLDGKPAITYTNTSLDTASITELRDAIHKRGLCYHAVSVCLSVCHMHYVKTNKLIFTLFHHRVATPFSTFRYEMLWQYCDGNPLMAAKIAIFDQYLVLASMTDGPSGVVNSFGGRV